MDNLSCSCWHCRWASHTSCSWQKGGYPSAVGDCINSKLTTHYHGRRSGMRSTEDLCLVHRCCWSLCCKSGTHWSDWTLNLETTLLSF